MINDKGEALVECPYDNTHLVTSKSLSKHLLRCRENHKLHKKVPCKFDKTHLVPRPELPHHLSICPSRYLLDRELQLKAAAGTEGVLSGDVKGPKIVTNYMAHDEEDWDSEPVSEVPIALFNRTEMTYHDRSNGSKTRNDFSEENTCRKVPLTSSKAAGIQSSTAIPNTGNQVYLLSIAQSMNAGWGRGRGRGTSPNQTLPSVGVVRPLAQSPVHSQEPAGNTAHLSIMNISQASRVAVERYSSTSDQFEDLQEPSVEDFYGGHLSDNSASRHAEIRPNDIQTSGTAFSSQNQLNFPNFSAIQVRDDLLEPQTLPKGRGYFRGFEQLRSPTSSSYAQGYISF